MILTTGKPTEDLPGCKFTVSTGMPASEQMPSKRVAALPRKSSQRGHAQLAADTEPPLPASDGLCGGAQNCPGQSVHAAEVARVLLVGGPVAIPCLGEVCAYRSPTTLTPSIVLLERGRSLTTWPRNVSCLYLHNWDQVPLAYVAIVAVIKRSRRLKYTCRSSVGLRKTSKRRRIKVPCVASIVRLITIVVYRVSMPYNMVGRKTASKNCTRARVSATRICS